MLTRVGSDQGTVGAFELFGRSATRSPFFTLSLPTGASEHSERVDRFEIFADVPTVHRVVQWSAP
jgi:hypothetical protein